jgi:hypothetical protein
MSGAQTAHFGAAHHFRSIDPFAGIGACLAYSCASTANHVVHRRMANHAIRRRLADRNAIEHELNVPFLHMPAAHVEADVEQRFLALVSAIPARLYGLLFFCVIVIHPLSLHKVPMLYSTASDSYFDSHQNSWRKIKNSSRGINRIEKICAEA